MSAAAGMRGLISTADLAARLGEPGLVILDVRSGPNGAGEQAFEAGHIPGARHTDYAADGWRQRVGNVPGLLPDAAHRAHLFGRLGLTPDDRIVVVPEGRSANDFAAAARIYWTLKVSGLNPVAILDGGTAAWLAEGRPLETGGMRHAKAHDTGIVEQPSLRATAADVAAASAAGQALVDGRAPSFYRGEEKASEAKAAGHIPGAVNIDYVTAFDPAAGRLRPLEELQALYAGVKPGPVVSYCNTGHTASLNWFVLSELMGRDATLYDGSMTEWTQDETRPVARG
jgi:thiosulfate/3-mercaptopyruvate sulfurtransferase